jgi:hypothetical protein
MSTSASNVPTALPCRCPEPAPAATPVDSAAPVDRTPDAGGGASCGDPLAAAADGLICGSALLTDTGLARLVEDPGAGSGASDGTGWTGATPGGWATCPVGTASGADGVGLVAGLCGCAGAGGAVTVTVCETEGGWAIAGLVAAPTVTVSDTCAALPATTAVATPSW